jgi:hypothetical protein
MTVANPFRTAFREVVATLRVDDAVVSTRPLGTLLPGQQRTVAFTGWTPPRPGAYRLRADLDGLGVLGNRLTSSATSTITIAGKEAVARTLTAPPPPLAAAPARSLTPLMRQGSPVAVRTLGGPSRGLGRPGAPRAMNAGTTLQITANSILL